MTKKLRIETLAEALKSCRFLFKKIVKYTK